MTSHLWQTGQTTCHATDGAPLPCPGSGQDAQHRAGAAWPEPRFAPRGEVVEDRLTGLTWLAEANPAQFPLAWSEALGWIAERNREGLAEFSDWRLPNRRELRSLISYQTRDPALPGGHPFVSVFPGWYWSCTSAAINPAFAWCVHLAGGRMFYGHKAQYNLVWPVRGAGNGLLAATGQTACFGDDGRPVDCADAPGQDGAARLGAAWPEPRFEAGVETVRDRLTGLVWLRNADAAGGLVTWAGALAAVAGLNQRGAGGRNDWRLPNLNELESLVDASRHSPALPAGHPFADVRETYWSATTSLYEPDWAWALYLAKGACGVGQKKAPHFWAWAVSGGLTEAR